MVGVELVEMGEEMTCPCCWTEMIQSVYVGGDHDPTEECPECGYHEGCGKCDAAMRARLAERDAREEK